MKLIPTIKQPARKHCVIALVALVIGVAMIWPLKTGRSEAKDAALEASATRIVTDHESGSFIFISKGEPIARLDAEGLHVLDNITYGGMLTDAGEEKLRQIMNPPKTEAAGE